MNKTYSLTMSFVCVYHMLSICYCINEIIIHCLSVMISQKTVMSVV